MYSALTIGARLWPSSRRSILKLAGLEQRCMSACVINRIAPVLSLARICIVARPKPATARNEQPLQLTDKVHIAEREMPTIIRVLSLGALGSDLSVSERRKRMTIQC